MIIGAFGDTHNCDNECISRTVFDEFVPRGAEVIAHTGDIEIQHIKPELYSSLPMICVLTKTQSLDPRFSFSPGNWRFVRPPYHEDPPKFVGNFTDPKANEQIAKLVEYFHRQRIYCRLVPIVSGDEMIMAYCGHERSFDILKDPQNVADFFAELNQVHDGVNLVLTGHTHHQFVYRHGNMTWVNPGSVMDSWNKTNEFAVINTANWEVVLGRLSSLEVQIEPVTVGIISDTGNIDQLDRNFWKRLVIEFGNRGVTHVICCGNFLPVDIGRLELAHFQVYYYLLPGLTDKIDKPSNWHFLPYHCPVIEIGGHRFYVQHEIGPEYANFSEIESKKAFGGLSAAHKHLDFVVAGLVPGTIFQETDGTYAFINPGDAREHGYFATVCLPRREYTLGTVGL